MSRLLQVSLDIMGGKMKCVCWNLLFVSFYKQILCCYTLRNSYKSYDYINTVIQLLLKLFLEINQVTKFIACVHFYAVFFVVIFGFWSNELNLNSVLVLCSYLVWLQSSLGLLILSFQWWVMFLSDSPSSLPDPFLCHCHASVMTTWLRKTISNTW